MRSWFLCGHLELIMELLIIETTVLFYTYVIYVSAMLVLRTKEAESLSHGRGVGLVAFFQLS